MHTHSSHTHVHTHAPQQDLHTSTRCTATHTRTCITWHAYNWHACIVKQTFLKSETYFAASAFDVMYIIMLYQTPPSEPFRLQLPFSLLCPPAAYFATSSFWPWAGHSDRFLAAFGLTSTSDKVFYHCLHHNGRLIVFDISFFVIHIFFGFCWIRDSNLWLDFSNTICAHSVIIFFCSRFAGFLSCVFIGSRKFTSIYE